MLRMRSRFEGANLKIVVIYQEMGVACAPDRAMDPACLHKNVHAEYSTLSILLAMRISKIYDRIAGSGLILTSAHFQGDPTVAIVTIYLPNFSTCLYAKRKACFRPPSLTHLNPPLIPSRMALPVPSISWTPGPGALKPCRAA